jgi:tRNA G46 methylase TrmB
MSTKKVRRNFHKGTKKIYINKLKNLYPKCKFDKNLDDYSLYSGNNITYGEMEYEGIKLLYSYINKNYNNKINSFIDVGSGRGKLCMYMAAQPKIKYVLGIELVKQRHDDAEILKTEIDHEYASKVTLLNTNVHTFNSSPVFTLIELETIKTITQIINYGINSDGIFCNPD